jgi:perosamine synthetase
MKVPLAKPEVLEQDIAAVVAVLRTPHLSQGPVLHAFEKALADYLSMSDAVAVNSGTSALQIALRALNVGDRDEVILPSFSFMAVTNAVLSERAIPVFVDIDPLTCNLDPAKLESAVSPKTKAIIIVNSFGIPAPSPDIITFAKRHSLATIDDACEALGSEHNGRKAGTFGDIGVFAFYPNKLITTGEGGALVTNSTRLAKRLRSLRNQGRQSDDWFQHGEPGFSCRLSDINCALGLEQLRRIETILQRRETLVKSYRTQLSRNPNLNDFTRGFKDARISWFTYPVLLNRQFRPQDRDWIWQELRRRGVESGRYFAPSHLQPALSDTLFKCGDVSATLSISQRLLCLPLFNSMTEEQINFVCNSLDEILCERLATRVLHTEVS